MNYGFRVSLPGKDVKTCEDKDLVITSKSPCFKIVEMGEVEFQFSASSASLTIAHNTPLPFMPIAYYSSDAIEGWRPIEDITFDSNNIYFDIFDTDTVTNPVLYYFILYG